MSFALTNGFNLEPKTPVSNEVPAKRYVLGFSDPIKASSSTNFSGFKKLGIEAEI